MADTDPLVPETENTTALDDAAKSPEDSADPTVTATGDPAVEEKPKRGSRSRAAKKEEVKDAAEAKAPTAAEARAAETNDPAPDPLDIHSERTLDVADSLGSDAIRAEYAAAERGDNSDLLRAGYQVSQFDTTGSGSVLDALAFPTERALNAEKRVEEVQGITVDRPDRPVIAADSLEDSDAEALTKSAPVDGEK
ncbi:hypothetical protein SEA_REDWATTLEHOG_32 [Gordonia phage RedWattleHog]|uniref:Uncharacterized protein n=1 Tax=Gordonia phage Stormageddon TaxID=2656541 RepID=A0A649VSG6_9CAUD|nr:hypothetical protein KHQ86_gp029 [Gordonia phage Stormageddon]QGJ94892.1 hypothetical protein SEA_STORMAGEDDON_29 [Gordonia phage Stormageddon]QLF83536.1 hypothetical protein SEA_REDWATTLEHOG_32 [Gordonia phage RedWattleHog]